MRPGLIGVLVLSTALLLAGCGRATRHGDGLARSAVAPTGALNAGGEPQWNAQLRGARLSFSTGEGAPLSVVASLSPKTKVGAAWSGPLPAQPGHAAAGQLRLTVIAKPCKDGPTGMSYPLSATVDVATQHYAGCAAAPGQGLGPRT